MHSRLKLKGKILQLFRKKKRIGIALGSGGAKGMAHLGVLQALRERGIDFDIYAGASAGSIVGALCACGYSPNDAAELLERVEYGKTAVDVVLHGREEAALSLINNLFGGREFSDLIKPFCATATDASNGETVLLESGSLAKAVLISSSVPPLFKGIQHNGRVLIDGAFSNAVPGDVARMLGADIVIGVSLSPLELYKQRDFLTVSGETIVIRQSGFRACDFILQPDLSEYKASNVLSMSKIYDIGYACASEHADEIARLVSR